MPCAHQLPGGGKNVVRPGAKHPSRRTEFISCNAIAIKRRDMTHMLSNRTTVHWYALPQRLNSSSSSQQPAASSQHHCSTCYLPYIAYLRRAGQGTESPQATSPGPLLGPLPSVKSRPCEYSTTPALYRTGTAECNGQPPGSTGLARHSPSHLLRKMPHT